MNRDCCILLISTDSDTDLSVHEKPRDAFLHAREWIEDNYPRERIYTMGDLREFEEEHGFLFDFRYLNRTDLEINEI